MPFIECLHLLLSLLTPDQCDDYHSWRYSFSYQDSIPLSARLPPVIKLQLSLNRFESSKPVRLNALARLKSFSRFATEAWKGFSSCLTFSFVDVQYEDCTIAEVKTHYVMYKVGTSGFIDLQISQLAWIYTCMYTPYNYLSIENIKYFKFANLEIH